MSFRRCSSISNNLLKALKWNDIRYNVNRFCTTTTLKNNKDDKVNINNSTRKIDDKKTNDKINKCSTNDNDNGNDDELDELEDMFVMGPKGIEWNGPTRGGRQPEPTRYGDWERKGRASDF